MVSHAGFNPETGHSDNSERAASLNLNSVCHVYPQTDREAITVDYSEGGVIEVPQHDGSILELRKLEADYDPSNKINALTHVATAAAEGEFLTGLLYLDPKAEDLHAHLKTSATPLNQLGVKELCPGSEMLDKSSASLR